MSDQMPPSGQPEPNGPPVDEFQTRERVSVALLVAAEVMASASEAARGENNSGAAKDFAAAAKDLTDAHVVLSPIVAAGQIAESAQASQLP